MNGLNKIISIGPLYSTNISQSWYDPQQFLPYVSGQNIFHSCVFSMLTHVLSLLSFSPDVRSHGSPCLFQPERLFVATRLQALQTSVTDIQSIKLSHSKIISTIFSGISAVTHKTKQNKTKPKNYKSINQSSHEYDSVTKHNSLNLLKSYHLFI